jgi:hypothetical protein
MRWPARDDSPSRTGIEGKERQLGTRFQAADGNNASVMPSEIIRHLNRIKEDWVPWFACTQANHAAARMASGSPRKPWHSISPFQLDKTAVAN